MNILPTQTLPLHFVGIGGIGMSGIAEVLHHSGFKVQGSDICESYNTKRLEKLGIPIFIGHDAKHIKHVQAIVVSTAVKINNPEFQEALSRHIPIMHRADMLAEIMRNRTSIAIGGTHGKTTTTSLMAWLLDTAKMDPTVINGGIINEYNTNARLGKSCWAVVEADESDGSFTRLSATLAVVTNIDPEHMDHYGSFEKIKEAFIHFIRNVPFYGAGIVCIDHPVVKELKDTITDRRIITYGFDTAADVYATNIRLNQNGVLFDVHLQSAYLEKQRSLAMVVDKKIISLPSVLKDVFLPMMGKHNVQNALAIIVAAQELGINESILRESLHTFKGVRRRFTSVGNVHGVTVIDDYAHHPAEITAVLASARQAASGEIHAIVQPHRYSRLKDLFNDFASSFSKCASVLVAPVYSAGEEPNGTTSEQLATALTEKGVNAQHFNDPAQILSLLTPKLKSGDMVLFMGAGDITYWTKDFVENLEKIFTLKS